jgi:hypothetical protein
VNNQLILDNHALPLNLRFLEQVHHKKDFAPSEELSQLTEELEILISRRDLLT